MSPIERMIDSNMHCLLCGKTGGGIRSCGCWVKCACGLWVERGKPCLHPVHSDPEIAHALANGYWVIDPNTGRPYKTRTGSLEVLRNRAKAGTIYFSRKEANQAVREIARREKNAL